MRSSSPVVMLALGFIFAVAGCAGSATEPTDSREPAPSPSSPPTESTPPTGKPGEDPPPTMPDKTPTNINDLPYSGGKDAPVVAGITVRCTGPRIALSVVVTDPDGIDDLEGLYNQSVGLFRNADASGVPETRVFNVSSTGAYFNGSAVAEFFIKTEDAPLRAKICAADTWPAQVVVIDKTGHATSGKVHATRVD